MACMFKSRINMALIRNVQKVHWHLNLLYFFPLVTSVLFYVIMQYMQYVMPLDSIVKRYNEIVSPFLIPIYLIVVHAIPPIL